MFRDPKVCSYVLFLQNNGVMEDYITIVTIGGRLMRVGTIMIISVVVS